MGAYRHPANIDQSPGARAAAAVTQYLGSWRFIIAQTAVVAAWMTFNVLAVVWKWDPYPFILLNLAFSLQAAYTGPLVLLSSNRAAEHDRARAEHAYTVGEDTLGRLTALQEEHYEMRRNLRNGQEAMVVLSEQVAMELGEIRKVVAPKPAARKPAARKTPTKA